MTPGKHFVFFLLLIQFACSSVNDSENNIEGEWMAMWETNPAGYPGLSDQLDFTMNGKFLIEKDSITIDGYGYKGCIFSEDTIHHKLVWKIQNDSLLLYNEPNSPGLVYKIEEMKKNLVRLQLEDIFVTLSK